jgi:DNA polymerase I-like protein with 3'-5' exonuclease and polymerase domains
MEIWPGIFVENVTQATAADLMRGTLVRLEQQAFCTRIHTHDEILVECAESNAKHVSERLSRIMRQGFDWSEGLPLMSDEQTGYYYTKQEDTGI